MTDAIRQEAIINAAPKDVFKALTDGAVFAKITGAPAEISAKAGAAFSCFGGQIEGRFIELADSERLVQAWRPGAWDAGVYSLVKFDLAAEGGKTKLTLNQSGYPEGAKEHLEGGWQKMYFEPLAAHFG